MGEIESWIENILAARSGSELVGIVPNLQTAVDDLYQDQGTSIGVLRPTISLRNFVVQNNYVVKSADGSYDWESADNLLEEYRDEEGNVVSSDEHWRLFLESCLVYNEEIEDNVLVIPFATSSLDSSFDTAYLSPAEPDELALSPSLWSIMNKPWPESPILSSI